MSVKSRRCGAKDAEAVVVVAVRRRVVVAIRRPAVARRVVPTPAPFHAVRARRSSPSPPNAYSPAPRPRQEKRSRQRRDAVLIGFFREHALAEESVERRGAPLGRMMSAAYGVGAGGHTHIKDLFPSD